MNGKRKKGMSVNKVGNYVRLEFPFTSGPITAKSFIASTPQQ